MFGKQKQFEKLNMLLGNSFKNMREDILRINQRIDNIEATLASANLGAMRDYMDFQEREVESIKKMVAEKLAEKEIGDKKAIKEGQVKIVNVQFEAPGSEKGSLNGEWVELEGYGLDMSGYTLHDKGKKHIYKFPKGFEIHGKIRVFTGKGKDTSTKLFWNNPRPIWNDEDDVASLLDQKGRIVSKVRSRRVHDFEELA